MAALATTKMSSRGQVVIPEEIRNSLGLHTGAHFVAFGSGDTVILKLVTEPSMEHFDEIVGDLRQAAKKSKLKKSDLDQAIKEVRSRK